MILANKVCPFNASEHSFTPYQKAGTPCRNLAKASGDPFLALDQSPTPSGAGVKVGATRPFGRVKLGLGSSSVFAQPLKAKRARTAASKKAPHFMIVFMVPPKFVNFPDFGGAAWLLRPLGGRPRRMHAVTDGRCFHIILPRSVFEK
jgi:hypothetical protein